MLISQIISPDFADKKIKYLVGILLSLILGSVIYFYGGSISGDDTFIYMRYVNNINNGNGFCYNLSEKSFGATSMIWPLFMVPITKVFGNSIEVWKFTACLIAVIRALVIFLFLISFNLNFLKSSFLTFFSFLDPHTFRWISSGMENSIAIFFLTLIAILYYQFTTSKHSNFMHISLLGMLVGMLPFLRPEFGLYSVGIIIASIFKYRKKSSSLLISIVLSILICATCTYLITGFLIPQTASAKALSLFNGHISAFVQTFKIIISGAIGALILLLLSTKYTSVSKSWNSITIIALLISVIYLGVIGQLVSTRYAIFLCSPIILATTISIANEFKNKINNKIKSFIVLQIIIFMGILLYVFPSTRLSEEQDIRQLAEYSRTNLPHNARIALTEIGIFGYYSDRYIIDLIGLVDPSTLDWLKKYGRPTDIKEMEDLLIFRKATHYINCFSENEKLDGEKLNFNLLKTVRVVRNNLSTGEPLQSYWRLYSINVKQGAKQL